jgi:hypothetical protein
MKRLFLLVPFLLLGALGCGPSVSAYTVPTRLGGAGPVEAMHEWERFGERFNHPGIRRVQPSIAQLNRLSEAAGWTQYADDRACFAILSLQRTSLVFADNLQNQHDEVVDWRSATHELLLASGAKLLPMGPPQVREGEPVVVRYDSFDNANGRWIPAQETFKRSGTEVCFATPTPLAREPWVKWAYTLPNDTRTELTFQIQAPR